MCKDDPSPAAKEYWTKRQALLFDRKAVDLLAGLDKELSALQEHVCPVCNSSLHSGERLQRHHVIERALGGKDTLMERIRSEIYFSFIPFVTVACIMAVIWTFGELTYYLLKKLIHRSQHVEK
uniref:Putative encoded protein n=1 Tax=Dunaliella salina TaxID=3046 RepID=A0A1C8XRI5_DUNSA|nr:putative encoded protein [Dunaliella salina]|eukprot:1160348-Pelagomonas_calceolata.AAC.3